MERKTDLLEIMKNVALAVALPAALLLACSDDTVNTYDLGQPEAGQLDKGQADKGQADKGQADKAKTDGKPKPDQGKDATPPADKAPPQPDSTPPGPFTCAADCSEYVMDRFIMPVTAAMATKVGLVHKGQTYNALGNMLALLMQQAPTLELQASVDNDVCAGNTINLLRVKAKSLTSEPAVKGQWWLGMPFLCCTKKVCLDTKVKTQCEAGSKLKCFGGTGKFQVDKSTPGNLYLAGAITGGALKFSAGKLSVRLSLSGGGGMDVPLKVATLTGQISKSDITGGVLTGGVNQADVSAVIIPGLTPILNKLYKSTTDQKTKDGLKKLFDTNADGTITGAELAANPLIKSGLGGDVDLDGDGKNEVSVGLGFTAVRAAINTN